VRQGEKKEKRIREYVDPLYIKSLDHPVICFFSSRREEEKTGAREASSRFLKKKRRKGKLLPAMQKGEKKPGRLRRETRKKTGGFCTLVPSGPPTSGEKEKNGGTGKKGREGEITRPERKRPIPPGTGRRSTFIR